VGGDPARFGRSPSEFHDRAGAGAWAMLATSTHDTKRSEDVRARLVLLSQIPDRWAAAVRGWSAANQVHRTGDWPDPAMEYLLYQTLVGAWPLSHERAAAYVEKAAREAKQHTSWLAPNADYEDALRQFVKAVLEDEVFVAGLEAFVSTLVEPGRITSLAQTLVKLTAPGVPDLYQGTELWDLSLVDPDNRRPVDFDLRRRLLAQTEAASAGEAWDRADEGVAKLFVVQRALRVRRERPELLDPDAAYRAVPGDDGVLAFARGEGLVTVVPRFAMRPPTGTVELPPGEWEDVFTGVSIDGGSRPVADVLAGFPVALLLRR
jgi:(1->4)-alpha-D-glucan 1-alpha-D-glucosylmutase